MYNPNDYNVYNPYGYQMQPNPEMMPKPENSEEEGSDTDSEESPTNSFNNNEYLGNPMAQSTPTMPRQDMNMNQQPMWPNYPPNGFQGMFGFGQQPQQYAEQYTTPNQARSPQEDSQDSSGGSSLVLPQNIENLPENMINFCTVPGRLSLLGCNKKLVVTLAEIRRRINPPECLNQSILSAILRKAKNKDGGNKLNQQLKQHSITLAQGRRKSAPNSSFTALCETESLTLATDFHKLSDQHFPFNSTCYEIMRMCHDQNEFFNKLTMYRCASEALKEVLNVISRDKTPLMDMPLDPPLIMHPESQKEFTNFSLLTHGFGVPGHAASWSTALKLIDTLNRVSMNPKAFCSQIQRPEFHWMEQKPFLPMQPPTNNFNF